MNEELDLFAEPAHARRTDPATSHEAAASVDTTTLERLVLNALDTWGPMTMHQVATALRLDLVTVSPRFAPLRRKGLIESIGRDGRRTVWRKRGVSR